jgi:hypothetical protein
VKLHEKRLAIISIAEIAIALGSIVAVNAFGRLPSNATQEKTLYDFLYYSNKYEQENTQHGPENSRAILAPCVRDSPNTLTDVQLTL